MAFRTELSWAELSSIPSSKIFYDLRISPLLSSDLSKLGILSVAQDCIIKTPYNWIQISWFLERSSGIKTRATHITHITHMLLQVEICAVKLKYWYIDVDGMVWLGISLIKHVLSMCKFVCVCVCLEAHTNSCLIESEKKFINKVWWASERAGCFISERCAMGEEWRYGKYIFI